MKGFGVVFSIIVLIALGIGLISFVFSEASRGQVRNFLVILEEKRVITGVVGLAILAVGCSLFFFSLRRFSREPSMSFQNPEGEVRVTFSAIEDFIKRLGGKLAEVREMRPQVLATREGLEIYNRIILEPNVNIPEATSRIQEIIKKHVKDVLGIKDIIAIKVLVIKIASEKMGKGKEKEEAPLPPKPVSPEVEKWEG